MDLYKDAANEDEVENKERKKVKPEDLKDKFLRQFVKEKIDAETDTTVKNQLIDDIMGNNNFSAIPNLEQKIEAFKADNNDYKDFDLDKINIFDLKRYVGKEFLKIDNARKKLKAKVLGDYDIKEVEYNSKIASSIKSMSEYDLDKILQSELQLRKKLKALLGRELVEKTTSVLLSRLNKNEVRTRVANLPSDEAREDVKRILNDLGNFKVRDSDIRLLFEYGFLKKDEKAEFISKYIPTITLKRAVDLALMTKKDANTKKKTILEPILRAKNLGQVQIDEVIDKTSLDDIDIETRTLNSIGNENTLDKLAQSVGFARMEETSKDFLKDVVSNVKDNGPQTLDELKVGLNSINKNGRFQNIEKFKEGAIIELIKKGPNNKEIHSFIKVLKTDDNDRSLSYLPIGEGDKINLNLVGEAKNTSYAEFFKKFQAGTSTTKLDFFTRDDIKERIKDPNATLTASDLNLYTADDIQDTQKRADYLEKYKADVETRLGGLKTELENEKAKGNTSQLLDTRIKDLEGELKDANKLLVDDDNLLGYLNFNELIDKVDALDSAGTKLGLYKGLVLETKNGTVHEIDGIDKIAQTIDIKTRMAAGVYKPEPSLSYETFYQSFKRQEAKRVEKFGDFGALLKYFERGDKKGWKDHEFKDGKLLAKDVQDGDDKGDREIEYFISDKNELIRIDSISGDKVTIQTGEIKTEEKKGKKGKKEDIDTLYISNTKETITLNELKKYLEDNKFHPDWQIGKDKKTQSLKDLNKDFHGGFFTRIFNKNFSISELVAGGKMFVDSIKESLKRGNDVHTAKAALKMGKFLPDEFKADLEIKVETAEAAEMEKHIASLGKVDSWMAIKRIKEWIINKDTPEYKKEAGMLFMLQKYGTLTAKGDLYPYRGKRLWYEAFGGRINDKFFLEQKANAEKGNITFSEETLMWEFVKKQCGKDYKDYGGIKRRSRLHKEYEKHFKTGIKEEFKKGHEDAESKRDADAMLKGGMNEAKGGTTSNAIGWFKKAVERGGTLETMSAGFFCLLYSGTLYNTDQATFLLLKSLWDMDGMPIIMTRFTSHKSEMLIFNKAVLAVAKKIQLHYGKEFPDIEKDAQALFNDALEGKGKEKDRLERAMEFWKTYGTPLSRALNMNHTDDTTYAKTDKIVFLNKDKDSDIGKYYNMVRDFTDEDTFKQGFMEDWCGTEGAGGLNVYRATKKYIGFNSSGGNKTDIASTFFWNGFVKDIEATRKRCKDGGLSEEDGEKYVIQMLKEFAAGALDNQGGRPEALASFNLDNTMTGLKLNEWKFDLSKVLEGCNSTTLIKTTNEDWRFKKIAKNILDGRMSGGRADTYNDYLGSTIENVKNRVAANDSWGGDE